MVLILASWRNSPVQTQGSGCVDSIVLGLMVVYVEAGLCKLVVSEKAFSLQ